MALMHAPFEMDFDTGDLPDFREVVSKANALGMVPLSELPKPITFSLRRTMEKVGIVLGEDHPVKAGYVPGTYRDWTFRVLASAEKPE